MRTDVTIQTSPLAGAPPGSHDTLATLGAIALAAGAPEVAREAADLAGRLAEGRFYVACVGQFKRGKSTLINALVGHTLLPVGVVPVTAVVTVLRCGAPLRARVRLPTGWQEIAISDVAAYVSEEHNPANHKGVSIVEVFVPSALLASGMCLVDTPGIGSVNAANTAATRAFVPHIDAALVVIGADPPISGEELGLIEEIAKGVRHLFFVLNKADRLAPAECREAAAFAHRVLAQRLPRTVGPIFEVSATERLAGRDERRDWREMEAAIETLATTAGAGLVSQAEQRGVELLLQRVGLEIDEQRKALLRPVAESERRVASLHACVVEAERAINDLGPLFTSEQQRLHDRFREQRERFLAAALPTIHSEFAAAFGALSGRRDELRSAAGRVARQLASQWTDRWLDEAEPAAERLYREVAERFAMLADEFLARLAASEPALGTLPRTVSPEVGFRVPSRFYSTDLMHLTSRSAMRWLVGLIEPPGTARRAILGEASAYLERLVTTNSARIANSLDDRVVESRRRLEAEIRVALRAVATSAQRALDRARQHHAAGRLAVRAEVERLSELAEQVRALRTRSWNAATNCDRMVATEVTEA